METWERSHSKTVDHFKSGWCTNIAPRFEVGVARVTVIGSKDLLWPCGRFNFQPSSPTLVYFRDQSAV